MAEDAGGDRAPQSDTPRPSQDLPPDPTGASHEWLEAPEERPAARQVQPSHPGWFVGLQERWMEWRLERAERARQKREERLAAGATGWRRAWDEWCLERAERARIRREQREAQRQARLEARSIALARTTERAQEFRASVEEAIRFGFWERVREFLARRRLAIVGVLCLMAVSGLVGAWLMRTRHRRYLTGTLVAVNGVSIRRDQFYDELVAKYGEATLKSMVERELRGQFVRAHGAEATNRDVEERFRVEARNRDFFKTLGEMGVSETDYRGSLKRVLGEIKLMTQGVEVTEAEIREFYRKNVDPRNLRAMFYSPPMLTVAVIVTPNEATARQALAALKAGAPFGDVAARYSIHDSAARGGLVPRFALGRSYIAVVTGLDAIVRDLQEGQQVGPVRIGNMWWIVRCLSRTPAITRPYHEVKETAAIFARLAKGMAKNKARLDAEFEKFRRSARIQRFAPR